MPFHIQKLSDHGTGTPAVARTMVQGCDILNFFLAPDEKKEKCKKRLWDLQNQFIRCIDERDSLAAEVMAGRCGGFTSQGRGAVQLPGVANLQSRCENFLQSAKMVARETARLAEPFYAGKFDHRFHSFAAWAEKQFGLNDDFTKCIQHWEPFVKELVRWRNAVDHPSSERGGELLTYNFRVTEVRGQPRLLDPMWGLSEEYEEPIVEAMTELIDGLLLMYEDIFAQMFYKLKSPQFPLILVEVPESERKKECPIRLRVTIQQEHLDHAGKSQ